MNTQKYLKGLFDGPVRLAVVGPGESGKSTLCRMLAESIGFRYQGSTSQFAESTVRKYAESKYPLYLARDIMDDKWDHREVWSDAIRFHNRDDPLRLYREIAESSDIIDGIRKLDELKDCFEAGLVNRCLWVKRRAAPEDESLGFEAIDALKIFDIPRFRIVPNNRTREELLEVGRRAVEAMSPAPGKSGKVYLDFRGQIKAAHPWVCLKVQ